MSVVPPLRGYVCATCGQKYPSIDKMRQCDMEGMVRFIYHKLGGISPYEDEMIESLTSNGP